MIEVWSLPKLEYLSLLENGTQQGGSVAFCAEEESKGVDDYKIYLITAYVLLIVVGVSGNAWVAVVIGRLLADESSGSTTATSRGSMAAANGSGRTNSQKTAAVARSTSTNSQPAPRPIQIYIFALCCSDLIVLCFLTCLVLDLAYGRWVAPSSTLLCQLYLCSESLNKFCGPFFLVALSGYCYVRVCRNDACCSASTTPKTPDLNSNGVTVKKKKWAFWKLSISRTLLRTEFCLLVIGACLCFVFVLITPVYMYGDVHYLLLINESCVISVTPKCAFQPAESILTAFTIYSFLIGYVLPASLFTFFYAAIMRRAFRHARRRASSQYEDRRSKPPRHHGSSTSGLLSTSGSISSSAAAGGRRSPKTYLGRVVKTTMGLVFFFLVCWSPYWFMAIYQYTVPDYAQGQASNGVIVVGYLIHLLPYVNICGYPFLYTVLNKGIKDSYTRVKLKKELRNSSRLVSIARQQSTIKLGGASGPGSIGNGSGQQQQQHNVLQSKLSRCQSRCSSFFFVENTSPVSPKSRSTADHV